MAALVGGDRGFPYLGPCLQRVRLPLCPVGILRIQNNGSRATFPFFS